MFLTYMLCQLIKDHLRLIESAYVLFLSTFPYVSNAAIPVLPPWSVDRSEDSRRQNRRRDNNEDANMDDDDAEHDDDDDDDENYNDDAPAADFEDWIDHLRKLVHASLTLVKKRKKKKSPAGKGAIGGPKRRVTTSNLLATATGTGKDQPPTGQQLPVP